ncbi:MAG TPA: hypothetical protein VF789_08320 [Thermoanaerobaculia bacterium]
MALAEHIFNLLFFAFSAAILIAALAAHYRKSSNLASQDEVAFRGVEVEAEVLGRFLAGAPEGSDLAKRRQVLMTPDDPLELELRYVFDGRAIVSRGEVSTETFFRTRGMKSLKIKVFPSMPERWAVPR